MPVQTALQLGLPEMMEVRQDRGDGGEAGQARGHSRDEEMCRAMRHDLFCMSLVLLLLLMLMLGSLSLLFLIIHPTVYWRLTATALPLRSILECHRAHVLQNRSCGIQL